MEGAALLFWAEVQGKGSSVFMQYFQGGPMAPSKGAYAVGSPGIPYSCGMAWNHSIRSFQVLFLKTGQTPEVRDIGINLESSCNSRLPLAEWHSGQPMRGSLLNLDGQTTASVTFATQDDSSTMDDRGREWPFGVARCVRDQLQPKITPKSYDTKTTKELLTHQWSFARTEGGAPPTNAEGHMERGFSQLVSLPFSNRVYALKRGNFNSLKISTMPTSAFNNILISPDFAFTDYTLDCAPTMTNAATMIAVQCNNPNIAPKLHVFWVDQGANPTGPGTGPTGIICYTTVGLRDMNSGVYGEIQTEPGTWYTKPSITRLPNEATTNRMSVVRINDWLALYFNYGGDIYVKYAEILNDGNLGAWSDAKQRAKGSLLAVCPMPLSSVPSQT